MSTWLVYFCVALAIFLLIARIKGMEHLLRLFFGLFGKLAEAVFSHWFLWVGWLIRGLVRAHMDVVRHLFSTEEDYDIELLVKNQERGSDTVETPGVLEQASKGVKAVKGFAKGKKVA